jgi:hypothetical protein
MSPPMAASQDLPPKVFKSRVATTAARHVALPQINCRLVILFIIEFQRSKKLNV